VRDSRCQRPRASRIDGIASGFQNLDGCGGASAVSANTLPWRACPAASRGAAIEDAKESGRQLRWKSNRDPADGI